MKQEQNYNPYGWPQNPDWEQQVPGSAWRTAGNGTEKVVVKSAVEISKNGGSPAVRGTMDKPVAKFAVEAGSK
ncbi:hypothetical protein A2210_02125 [Candidatus Woesebacteria bacterium RIFOXYA1_FULL_40_18]|uniref:Uncharacterized protein n=2 Tax=Candidatus Woeseibacteriota TaxID=1752722 RepID=A0A1F8CJR5_9BACT|nr:MAG: hypothetical protein A2210_02125 [Candidatus Woesebacteria bacterium RIFOXYA1_FULL_40_18]OGM88359.1 MAG: hypothetical protein A2614_01105 [Candidatus Woesebacteria bacterium RIFOXYD1_FULL_40_21]